MTNLGVSSNPGEPYRIVRLASDDAEVMQYVVDTNVVSHVERLIRGGAPDEASLKAAAFCRELAAHAEVAIIDDFAWIEGASFHQPAGLSPTSIVIRDVAARLLMSRPTDLMATVADLSGWQLPDGYETEVRRNLDTALSAMMLTVVPCYFAAIVLEGRYGNASPSALTADDVIDVLTELSDQLNYVPGILLAALKLACIGNAESRTAAMRVLKTGRKTKKEKEYMPIRNALSAAWDLGVLQLLSAKLAQGLNAALVTSDEALADLAERITILSFGGVMIREDSVADSLSATTDAQRIDAAYTFLRSAAKPELRSRHHVAAALQRIESRLGASSTLPDVLANGMRLNLPPARFTDLDLCLLRNLLAAQSPGAVETALDELLNDTHEALRDRFDAVLMFSSSVVALIGAVLKVSPTDVLEPLAHRGDYGRDVASDLLSFACAHEELFTVSVYRELLRRPGAIRVKLASITGGVRLIVHHWADTLGITPEDLAKEAERQLICNIETTPSKSHPDHSAQP